MEPKTLEELMKLSPSEREELVTTDCDNADDDDDVEAEYELDAQHEADEETIAELRRRSAEGRADPGSDIPWSEIERKLRAITGE
jgi:putative addiction module component (TIGR02574 family)